MSQPAYAQRPAPPQDPALRELATLLQLGRRTRGAQSAEVIGFVAVNESRELFEYRQAALGRASALSQALPGEVMAVSGLPQVDPQAPYVQWLRNLFRFLARQDLPEPGAAVRPLRAKDLPDLLAREWAAWLPEHALLLPLQGPDGQVLAHLLCARERPWDEHELVLATELAGIYGYTLARFVAADSWHLRLRRWALPAKSRWWLALASLAVCLIPVRLSVLAPAELTVNVEVTATGGEPAV